jgi:UDP-glucose 4-epimerase
MAEHALITGVAGFIGSNLLDYLLQHTDWEITGVDNLSTGSELNIRHHYNNSRFRFQNTDLSEIQTLKPFRFVFHLAALPRIQPSFDLVTEHITHNVTRAAYLLELMIREKHYPRFIYSGSSAVYGTPQIIPTPETERIDCLSPYAFQKYEVERYMELLSDRYPLDYVTLRYFNPYGPRSFNPANAFNAYSSVVGIFLDRAKRKAPLLITGDGKQQRDFIHVADLAKANYMAAIHPEKLNTCFNIGYGNTLSIYELARKISENFEFVPKREGEADITFADTSKAQSVLGWKPEIVMDDYLKSELAS